MALADSLIRNVSDFRKVAFDGKILLASSEILAALLGILTLMVNLGWLKGSIQSYKNIILCQ